MKAKLNRTRHSNKGRVLLSVVAERAGVSPATVSRYMNSPSKVSAVTQTRIMEAISSLNYIPDGRARALASQRSKAIGIVVPTIENSMFVTGVQHFQRAVAAHGYTLLLTTMEYDPEVEYEQVRSLVEQGAEAIFLVGAKRPQKTLDLLISRSIPFICGWILDHDASFPCCGVDYSEVYRRLVNSLVGAGHRKFGMVSGHLFRNDRLVERVLALRAALEERGVGLPDERITECDSSVEAGRKAVQRLLEQRDLPTAIICSSDILGLAAVLQCQSQGLRVPADISVVGSGDLDLVRHFSPKLSTLGSADAEIARTASNFLLNRLRGNDMANQIFPLKVDICWRETTGPAPSGMP